MLDTAAKTGLDAVKTSSKKLVHKTSEETGEFIGNKNTEKMVKLIPTLDMNSRNIKKIVIPPEKRQIIQEL